MITPMGGLAQGLKSAVTLGVLCALLVLAAVWGWSAATAPLPEDGPTAPCVPVDVSAGTKVYPDQVLVSVLNAGTREGLAGRTMQLLVDEGFAEGQTGNAPKDAEVAHAEVWAATANDPAARLLASWLGKGVKVRVRQSTLLGVTVVVGDEFRDLRQGRESVAAKEAVTVCSPPDSGL